MNKKIYLATSLLLALAACSGDDENNLVTSKEIIDISASINSGSRSRFTNAGGLSNLAFSDGDKIVVGVHNNSNGPTNFSEESCIRTLTVGTSNGINTYTPDVPLYWDDLGGRDANAFIWGVYTHGATSPTIDKSGAFNWSVAANQSGVTDFQTLDLLYSNNKTHLVYTPNTAAPSTRDKADLAFNHAMSRILINVKAGEGFTNAEFANATAVLKDQFTSVDVNLLAADTFKVANNSKTNVTMCLKSTPTTTDYAASFDAIVAPNKVYNVGDEIATLVINNNTYKLTANQAFINALGTSKALVKGKYYTFNITLGKSGIGFNATITDWIEGYTTPAGSYEAGQIIIDTTDKGASTSGNTMTGNFGLFQSNDGTNYDSNSSTAGVQPSTNCQYDSDNGTWTYSPNIYWQGKDDEEFFRGFYAGDNADNDKLFNANNSASLVAGDTDYQWGTSGNDKISPTSGNINMQFTHMMSSIIINLKTVTGGAAVNLEGAKVEIINTFKDGSIDLHTGAITLGSERKDYEVKFQKEKEGIYTHTTYALPQSLNGANGVVTDGNITTSDDAFVKITVNPNDPKETNTYYYKLNLTGITEWISNKTYIYNITIKKTEIEFTANIGDWVPAFDSEDIFIHL